MSGLLKAMLADTPALLWPCDGKTTLDSIKDISGNGRDGSVGGTIVGPAAPILPGSLLGSLEFNGTGASNYIYRAHEAGLDVGTGEFAFEFWFVCTNGTGNFVQVCGRDDDASGSGQVVYLNNGDGKVRFYLGGAVTGSNFRVSDGVLHHIVCQRVGTHGVIYVDTLLEADTAGMGGNCDHSSATRLGVVDGGYTTLAGKVGPFAYYTHSLSADRVEAHFAAGHREGVVMG